MAPLNNRTSSSNLDFDISILTSTMIFSPCLECNTFLYILNTSFFVTVTIIIVIIIVVVVVVVGRT
jgi:hypothetical protein